MPKNRKKNFNNLKNSFKLSEIFSLTESHVEPFSSIIFQILRYTSEQENSGKSQM
jgi:hypothetical protein